MATLALFAAGTALGGSMFGSGVVAFGMTAGAIGGFIGGTIGSMIDSAYLFPAIFGQDQQGPRMGDQPVMTGAEGSNMNWCIGPRNRVGATCIWKSEIIEEKGSRSVGKGGGSSVKTYEYFVDIAFSVCDTTDLPGNKIERVVKIYADTKLIYDGTSDIPDKYDSLTVYDGSQDTPDPLIVSYDGDEAIPFKQTAYIVINRLRLNDYGNRIPNISVVVEQKNPYTLQEAITDLMNRAGYEGTEYTVDRLDRCVNGYTVSGPQQMSRALAPMMLAFQVNVQEKDQIINFIPKGSEDTIIVATVEDLAAHSPGSDAPSPLDTTDNDDYDLPSEVVVQFNDTARDLEQGSQRQVRWDHPSQNRTTIKLPLSMEPSEARSVAMRYLWAAEAERQRVKLSLPPSYLALREGMSLRIPGIGGRTRELWVRRVTIGNDFRIEVEGAFYQPGVFDFEATVDDPTDTDDPTYSAPDTILAISDMPTLTTEEEDTIGLYYAVCARDPEKAWRGGQLWNSPNNVDYTEIAQTPVEAIIGETKSGFLSPQAQPHRWDKKSWFIVEVFEGALESASEADVLSGQNRAAIVSDTGESEIIAFTTATLLSTRTYRVSGLVRGLRGTAHLIGKHQNAGKRFLLGEIASVGFSERTFGEYAYWKAPALGGLLSDYDNQHVRVYGRTLRPFSPCNIRGSYASAQYDADLTLTWDRRMKYVRGLFSSKVLPDDESPEIYEIDIIRGNDPELGEVVRTIQVQGQRTVVYDGQAQSDDWMDGIPIAASVHQISQVVGRSPYGFGIFFRPEF